MTRSKSINRKTVLVTGASTGIGRATAIEFGKQNATVFLVARRVNELKKTKKLVDQFGGNGKIIRSDLTSLSSIDSLVEQVKKEVKFLDTLFFAADVWHLNRKHYFETELKDIPDELIRSSIDVGLKSSILITKKLYPQLTDGGSIIALSGSFSPNEIGCLPQFVVKKGVENFVKQLSLELKDKNIRTQVISPWYVWTESVKNMFPSIKNECLQPEEVAEFIVNLTDKKDQKSGYVWHLKKGTEPKGERL